MTFEVLAVVSELGNRKTHNALALPAPSRVRVPVKSGILEQAQARGKDLVQHIDVQGARQLKSRFPDAVTVFILAPSPKVLKERLCARGEDRDAVIERRLRDATREIENYSVYDYVLINRDLDESDVVLYAPNECGGPGSRTRSGP